LIPSHSEYKDHATSINEDVIGNKETLIEGNRAHHYGPRFKVRLRVSGVGENRFHRWIM
jgi:hypothetical protein